MEIKIKYHDGVSHIGKISVGDWIDLRASRDTFIRLGQDTMIPLGVSMRLPEGYEAIVAPRSSTYLRYGIIMTNSIGIIDNSFCGDGDEWRFPCRNVSGGDVIKDGYRGSFIPKDTRIAQFRIIPSMPPVDLVEVDSLGGDDRGGFGSTGV